MGKVKEKCKEQPKKSRNVSASESKLNSVGKKKVTRSKLKEINNNEQNPEKNSTCTKSSNKLQELNTKENLPQSKNLLYYLKETEVGEHFSNMQVWETPLVNHVSKLQPMNTLIPFQRRITAMTWNPFHPRFIAFGTKGGELLLMNFYLSPSGTSFSLLDGIGPGGAINSIKFHETKPNLIFTACLTGQLLVQDFEGKEDKVIYSTCAPLQNWVCSLDAVYEKRMLLSGDCKGQIYFTDMNNLTTNKLKIHTKKILHIETCRKNSNLFATASLDNSVKLWDLRMISNKKNEPLVSLPHNSGVSSVYFSEANCYSLLTTDQRDELRVYSTGTWQLKCKISHPHRQFQHLTPIKASWHPLEDIIVVGRFPVSNTTDEKTIDYFNAHTGKCLFRSSSIHTPGISSLNNFNCTGDTLISGVGRHIVIWKHSQEFMFSDDF